MEQLVQNAMRRAYQKPCVEQIRLIAEETVLADCKTSGQTGPNGTFGCAVVLNGDSCITVS